MIPVILAVKVLELIPTIRDKAESYNTTDTSGITDKVIPMIPVILVLKEIQLIPIYDTCYTSTKIIQPIPTISMILVP